MKQWLSIWSLGQKRSLKEFEEIKEAGFEGVEIWAEHLRAVEYLNFAAYHELEIGLHLPFHDLNVATPDPIIEDRMFSIMFEWIERLAEYGGNHATLHGGYAWASEDREETIIRVKERISLLRKKAKQNNVELLLENLIPDSLNYCHYIASNVHEWLDLIHDTNVKACLDIGHLAVMGEDPEETICKLGNDLAAIHLSDNDCLSDLHLLPGDGKNVSKSLLNLLHHFSGPIIYEINPYKYTLKDIVEYITMKEKVL